MSPLELMDRDTVTAVFDRRHRAHLRFQLWGEQFEHRIGTDSRMLWELNGGVFARSCENVVTSVLTGPGSTEPPASPAFQDLRQRWQGDCCEFMALGQFGPHRYSGVVAVRSLASGMEVDFDLADRCSGADGPIVCTYAVKLVTGLLLAAAPGRVEWLLDLWEFQPRLVLEAEPPARLEISQSDGFGNVVHVISGSPAGADQRCRYRWRWLTPPLEDS